MAQDQGRSGQFVPAVRRPASDESWVEISSQPSSSSLSSIAADEVITTGLRVSQDVDQRRRRRFVRSATTQLEARVISRAPSRRNGSSQEECEESEADSDKVLSSSNEELQPRFIVEDRHNDSPLSIPKSTGSVGSDGDSLQDDEDETGTALGPLDGSPVFTPQPNIFSHPPSGRLVQTESDSYFPPLPSSHTSSSRPTTSTSSAPPTTRQPIRTRSHTPYNVIAPSASVDHDAALRASLSTLLSCAAAARGLPKRERLSSTEASRSIAPPRVRGTNPAQPTLLRIIPESSLGRVEESTKESRSSEPPSSPSSLPSKRKSKSPMRDRGKRNRSAYSTHDENVMSISPTLTTWMVGAGVLVLFSAISFTAGYTLGKEVGRVDGMGSGGGGRSALSCATEASSSGISRGLGRRSGWRWGNASGVSA